MNDHVIPSAKLTVAGAETILDAATRKAEEIGQPQCIAVVDDGGHLLAFRRMDGAFALSTDTAIVKAVTAAIYRAPTGEMADGPDIRLAVATQGKRINLPGGLPVIVDGRCIGGIGIGSGTGEQDRICSNAGLAAFEGAETF
ncbi:MAG: glcg protein [Alphaproteobacteria bacterium]|nr:glcg protein [Alphaproteobacteria bacterium]|tara:strand:+ start:920 stop:1345 length:426 start_codon:yes stop_codon:yes gene_type:complete